MRFIRSITEIIPKQPNGKTILYMHGYGGYTWQAARQLKVLQKAGYKIFALDFKKILGWHNPADLIGLMDEVDDFLQKSKILNKDLLIIGISIGGLTGYNLIRRHKELHKLLVITGGNISLLPSDRVLKKKWKLSREDLAKIWEPVNMYTKPGQMRNKDVVMLLPLRDKIIDPDEVAAEIEIQKKFNNITLVRTKGGHYRTIITETIIKPNGVFKYLSKLEAN